MVELNLNDFDETKKEELFNRVHALLETVLYQGISIGSDLSENGLSSEQESKLLERLKIMTNRIFDDSVWKLSPPSTYKDSDK